VVTDARGRYLRLCPDILTTDDELERAAAILGEIVGKGNAHGDRPRPAAAH